MQECCSSPIAQYLEIILLQTQAFALMHEQLQCSQAHLFLSSWLGKDIALKCAVVHSHQSNKPVLGAHSFTYYVIFKILKGIKSGCFGVLWFLDKETKKYLVGGNKNIKMYLHWHNYYNGECTQLLSLGLYFIHLDIFIDAWKHQRNNTYDLLDS